MIPVKSAPVAKSAPAKKKVMSPVYSLSVKAEGSEEYVNLTGLFERLTKNGVAFCGTAKEVNKVFWLFQNEKKDSKEIFYSLSVQEIDEEGNKGNITKVCQLSEKRTKKGQQMFVGEHDGLSYFAIKKAEVK